MPRIHTCSLQGCYFKQCVFIVSIYNQIPAIDDYYKTSDIKKNLFQQDIDFF